MAAVKVAALIPAYNEAALIAQTLSAVANLEPGTAIVVVNDGSTDNTADVVLQVPGVTLFNLPENRGKGAALNWAWERVPADIYLLLDADLGATAGLAKHLLNPVLSGMADMAVADIGPQQSVGTLRMGFGFARSVASWGIKILTGERVRSPLSGQRAVSARVLDSLGGFFPGFGVEVGLTVGALHYGYRVLEIPLAIKHRAYGRGIKGLKHRGRQLLHILRALWRCRQKGWKKKC